MREFFNWPALSQEFVKLEQVVEVLGCFKPAGIGGLLK